MNLFLARTGFGAWFGQPGAPRTEVTLYYDHRRDTLAGGLLLRGIGSGYLGFVGLRGDVWWTESWGFGAYVEQGSAFLLGAHARFRYGVPR